MANVEYVHFKRNYSILNRQLTRLWNTANFLYRFSCLSLEFPTGLLQVRILDSQSRLSQILSSSDHSCKQMCHLPPTKPVSLDAPLFHKHFFLKLPRRRSRNTRPFQCTSNIFIKLTSRTSSIQKLWLQMDCQIRFNCWIPSKDLSTTHQSCHCTMKMQTRAMKHCHN